MLPGQHVSLHYLILFDSCLACSWSVLGGCVLLGMQDGVSLLAIIDVSVKHMECKRVGKTGKTKGGDVGFLALRPQNAVQNRFR